MKTRGFDRFMRHGMKIVFLSIWALALSRLLTPAVAQTGETDRVAGLLASDLIRSAFMVLQDETLTVEMIEASVVLVEEALAIQPNNADGWRMMLRVASSADRDDLRLQAMRILSRLDPEDEVVRLMRLTEAIERFQTVELRIDAYRGMLSSRNRRHLGDATVSRLALDLALLSERMGDLEAFGKWIGEATILDPSNHRAAALATGFFSSQSKDPYARAELLCNQLLSDPTDLVVQVQLVELLFSRGAYEAAERIGNLLQQGADIEGLWLDNDMVADLASIQWARGQTEAALEMVSERQAELDQVYQQQLKEDQTDLLANQRASLEPPKEPLLATISAAIRSRSGSHQARMSFTGVQEAYRFAIAEAQSSQIDNAELAQLHLMLAWISLWLSEDVQQAAQSIRNADELLSLTDEARRRFEGWIALRSGDFEGAVGMLQPIAEQDPAARLGLALALVKQNQIRKSALNFLIVAREQPGTLMGVWAVDYLAEILGRRLALSDIAGRLNELIDTLPESLDRFVNDPTLALSLRIRPEKRIYDAFEPVIVEVEILNNSNFSFAVDTEGPVQPHVVLFPSVKLVSERQSSPLDPIVLDIDRVLRLNPRQRLILRVDLRQHNVGAVLNSHPLSGANVTVSGMINFHVRSDGALEPGLLGTSAVTPIFRINGVRTTDSWIERTTNLVNRDMASVDRVSLALLGHLAALPLSVDASPVRAQLIEAAKASVISSFSNLDPISQAWLLAVLPAGRVEEPILNMARKSSHRLVKLMYLLFQRTDLNDPMLDAALRGDDQAIRTIANMILSTAEDDVMAGAVPGVVPDDREDR